ncbi:MAG: polynucleotide adenylyltransferase PcnB [Gammaproteobacteria bacterium]|nr:polynucleotide adenylyltransferase PcnB [Gammaproteobacteria bacterium]
MIKSLFQKFKKVAQPKTIKLGRADHIISRKNISPNALKVLQRLNQAGFEAYLVGGGVRDLLLELSPKDFDIATSATPNEIKRLFSNCRLIGRRFRLAHILFGREVIEVATFRANHQSDNAENQHSKTSATGMLVRDNVYGTVEEDAFRRDFTINALYYCSKDFTLTDFTGGLADLKNRQLKLIGDPESRYTEDPVRILRAIRLSTKLNLNIESKTAKPIVKMAHMLTHVSSARLWEEMNKLFLSGYASTIWKNLLTYKVANELFPQTTKALKYDSYDSKTSNIRTTNNNHSVESSSPQDFSDFIYEALASTDKRIYQDLPVTPAFLFAVLLWKPLLDSISFHINKGLKPYVAYQKASTQVLNDQLALVSIPKRFSSVIREIWDLQSKLINQKPRQIYSVLSHPRFRAAYDFLCLRAGKDKQLSQLANWWTQIQLQDSQGQETMIGYLTRQSTKSNQRRRNYKEKQNKRRFTK